MINETETFDKFGYYPTDLKPQARGKICVNCDYCWLLFDVVMQDRTRSGKIINKDACKKCKYHKREEVCQKRDGVKNTSQKLEVRKVISNNCRGKKKTKKT